MNLKLQPVWERTARMKIGVICMAMIAREGGELKIATDDLIEWLRPHFQTEEVNQ